MGCPIVFESLLYKKTLVVNVKCTIGNWEWTFYIYITRYSYTSFTALDSTNTKPFPFPDGAPSLHGRPQQHLNGVDVATSCFLREVATTVFCVTRKRGIFYPPCVLGIVGGVKPLYCWCRLGGPLDDTLSRQKKIYIYLIVSDILLPFYNVLLMWR